MKKIFIIIVLCSFTWSCQKTDIAKPDPDKYPDPVIGDSSDPCEVVSNAECIEPYQQRQGDPEKGYNYLLYGDYIKSGIPYDLYITFLGTDANNYLNRTGDNEVISHEYTAVNASNGTRIVALNCFQCHSQTINNEFVLGLGNSSIDFTTRKDANVSLLRLGINSTYGDNSPEAEASEKFLTTLEAIAPNILTEVRGVNAADKLAAVLAAHRNPNNLSWDNTPSFQIPDEVIPSDVPAWWLLKKKNAMFYTGIGQQDFAKFMMTSSLLSLDNIEEASEIDKAFVDVLAYLKTLEAPNYPETVNSGEANEGLVIFNNKCATCHGTYGENETYPNILVPVESVGTDPLLAEANYNYPQFINTFNSSWFGVGENAGKLIAKNSYIAPPLDGIWATAPYLHNGSIPTIEDLLNSSQRPVYWKRSFDTSDYNYNKLGWNFSEESSAADKETYNTTKPGYSNSGHLYGDSLTEDERSALLEYLKTL